MKPTERNGEAQDSPNETMMILKGLIRIGCALIVLWGVYEGYSLFSLRYDDQILGSSIHQVFTVAEALGFVIISYCLARGIMILFNIDNKPQ